MEIFGPVQTRRFGMSLGINHLPPKICSYNCIYCQLGRTNQLSIVRTAYSQPEEIFRAVAERLQELPSPPDYLTFVSNGEPTLDTDLGKAIEILKPLKIKIAVISNASLVGDADVRAQLSAADAVSLKIDAVDETIWRKINRPQHNLRLEAIMDGMRAFATAYHGRLLTETMLIRNLNDTPQQLHACAAFVAEVAPEIAYLTLPLRAPAESWVEMPDPETQSQALKIFAEHFHRTALLGNLPPTHLDTSGNPLAALLETIRVHPMEREEVLGYLRAHHQPESVLDNWLEQDRIHASAYRGKTFYAANYAYTK